MTKADVIQWLAHDLQYVALELRQLVQEKHAVMRDAHFTGIRKRAAAKQTDIADGVMR